MFGGFGLHASFTFQPLPLCLLRRFLRQSFRFNTGKFGFAGLQVFLLQPHGVFCKGDVVRSFDLLGELFSGFSGSFGSLPLGQGLAYLVPQRVQKIAGGLALLVHGFRLFLPFGHQVFTEIVQYHFGLADPVRHRCDLFATLYCLRVGREGFGLGFDLSQQNVNAVLGEDLQCVGLAGLD